MPRLLRLATFNLETLDDRAADFEERLAILKPQIERLRADVLCLQEVNAIETAPKGPRRLAALERLIAGTLYADYAIHSSRSRPGLRIADRHNLVILTHLPVLEIRQIWHDQVAAPLWRSATRLPAKPEPEPIEWDRPILFAKLDLGLGRVLHLLNLHLRAPRAAYIAGQKADRERWHRMDGWAEGFFVAGVKRLGQALEARRLIDSLMDADPESRIVVLGDFNAADREAPLRLIRGDPEDTGNPRLARRALVALERGLPEGQRFSVIHHGQPVLIDHILVSRPLLSWYRGIELHNEMLGDELVSPMLAKGGPESYHAPMVASFALPGRARKKADP